MRDTSKSCPLDLISVHAMACNLHARSADGPPPEGELLRPGQVYACTCLRMQSRRQIFPEDCVAQYVCMFLCIALHSLRYASRCMVMIDVRIPLVAHFHLNAALLSCLLRFCCPSVSANCWQQGAINFTNSPFLWQQHHQHYLSLAYTCKDTPQSWSARATCQCLSLCASTLSDTCSRLAQPPLSLKNYSLQLCSAASVSVNFCLHSAVWWP